MYYLRPLRLTGWKLIAAVLVGALVLMLAASALFVLGVLLAVVLAVAMLHLLVLPRLARRLRISPLILDALLLPLLIGLAWLLTGSLQGILVAVIVWLAGVAVPILAVHWLRRRVAVSWSYSTASAPVFLPGDVRQERVLEVVRCERCGRAVWTEAPSTPTECPECGYPVGR